MGKKCTLLNLSRRPSVTAAGAQETGQIRSEERDLSSSAADGVMSAEDLESKEKLEKTLKEGTNELEKVEDESTAKMEVEPSCSLSDEQQGMAVSS